LAAVAFGGVAVEAGGVAVDGMVEGDFASAAPSDDEGLRFRVAEIEACRGLPNSLIWW
jgi:hypothetical protein